MLPKYFIMIIKITYPKISLAIAFTLSTSIGSRTIYTFSNDFYHPPKVVNIEKVVKMSSNQC